jgi:hypothetical protein
MYVVPWAKSGSPSDAARQVIIAVSVETVMRLLVTN